MIQKILEKIPKNAKWFDVIELSGSSTPVVFKNNRLYSIIEKQSSGFGSRINLEGKTGFSFTNDVENIESMVERAVTLSKFGEIENFELPKSAKMKFEPYDKKILQFDIKNEIETAIKSINMIKKKYPDSNNNLSINNTNGEMKLYNSEGLEASYKSSYYSASISTSIILDNNVKLDIWGSKSSMAPIQYKEIIEEILDKIEKSLEIRKISSGKVPILLTPKAFTSMLGILKSGFNAKSVFKGLSLFSDKMGEQIFNDSLTVYDDPLIKNSPFSFPYDDEGIESRKKALIMNGTISSFITDLKYAEKLKIEPTGNASRGYSSLPSPSFSNTVVENGKEKYRDILKNINNGILVDQFIGLGQSNTLTGDFSANLDLAYKIENGELAGRVKDCMISDNLFNLLKEDIVMSKEREITGATLAPYIYFPSVNFTG